MARTSILAMQGAFWRCKSCKVLLCNSGLLVQKGNCAEYTTVVSTARPPLAPVHWQCMHVMGREGKARVSFRAGGLGWEGVDLGGTIMYQILLPVS